MMSRVIIKNEKLPDRCEICHKSDKFNPKKNFCNRCKSIVIKDGRIIEKQINVKGIKDFVHYLIINSVKIIISAGIYFTVTGLSILGSIIICIFIIFIIAGIGINFDFENNIFFITLLTIIIFIFMVAGFTFGTLSSIRIIKNHFKSKRSEENNNNEIDVFIDNGPYWANTKNYNA